MTIATLMAHMDGKGWCTQEKATRLYELVKEAQPQITVELGVFYGKSLFALAEGHKENNKGFVLGVDPWNVKACLEGTNSEANNDWWKSLNFLEIQQSCFSDIERFGYSDYCCTMKMRSQNVAILIGDNSIDILHQDSNHNIETIISELKAWAPKLKNGAYWIIDDANWVEAKEAYSHLPEYGFELIEDHETWQIWRKKAV